MNGFRRKINEDKKPDNKTIILGFNDEQVHHSDELSQSVYDSLYRRSSNSGTGGRTVVMDSLDEEGIGGAYNNYDDSIFRPQLLSGEINDRVLIGVLSSMSHNLNGEIFPIYVGTNKIGCSQKNDVCLYETTVSPEHAILNVWHDVDDHENPFKVSIQDNESYYGIKVNGKDIDYGTCIVNDCDLITIGQHYRLLLHLFHIEQEQSTLCEEFIPIERPHGENDEQDVPLGSIDADFYQRRNDNSEIHTVLYANPKLNNI